MEVKADKLYMQLNAAELEAIIKKGEILILDQMYTYVHTTVQTIDIYMYILKQQTKHTLSIYIESKITCVSTNN